MTRNNNSANNISSSGIQFLSIGHFTHDVVGSELILGGASAYSSATARKLGLNAGVITSVGRDFLHFDKLHDVSLIVIGKIDKSASEYPTTTFENIYENDVRRQFIRGVSAVIYANHIPDNWCDIDIVYLCPVANEVDSSIVHKFPDSIIGASPQGWMRKWDSDGCVSPRKWDEAPKVLPYVDALIMSEEDISPFPDIVEEYASMVKILVLTRGESGSTLFCDGKEVNFPAFKVNVLDPTGAGDVFATAFLIKLKQSQDPYEASIFANCAASFVVEKRGTEGIPDYKQVQSRLESNIQI
ncbi:MAG: PfkB family carbohydrate kinase [Candidatus Poribacteria bacterium]